MSFLWEKSSSWRWIVRQTRDSKPFFFAFATVCGVVPGAIGYCVMQLTNSSNEQLESELRRNARPDTLVSTSLSISLSRRIVICFSIRKNNSYTLSHLTCYCLIDAPLMKILAFQVIYLLNLIDQHTIKLDFYMILHRNGKARSSVIVILVS